MFKNQKGITLVALVITIIVLLILAGVTIAMVVGDNGILTRSNQAKFENRAAEIKEKVEISVADLAADVQVQLAKDSSFGGYNGEKLADVFERTVGAGNVATSAADGKYVIKVGSATVDPTDDGTSPVLSNTSSTTAQVVTIEYYDTTLRNSAKNGSSWKSSGKLTYTFSVSANLAIGNVTEGSGNDGGY
ncbi:MAG: hypothetical protein IKG42_02900 [Clostridia bacterium]|nr:hypothetical protein [Clostridia bacterium]